MPAGFPPASLAVQQLACVRGGRRVFDALRFELAAGQVLLLRGANGAGKSSLLRILATLTPPAAGSVQWCGQDIRRDIDSYRASLRFLSHQDAIKPVLRVRENVAYAGALADPHLTPAAIDAALQALDLGPLAQLPARFLSAGQRRRLALARLIAVPAPLWLLDEPGAGLDRASLQRLHQLIDAHGQRGGIVIASTHGDLDLPNARTLDLSTLAAAA